MRLIKYRKHLIFIGFLLTSILITLTIYYSINQKTLKLTNDKQNSASILLTQDIAIQESNLISLKKETSSTNEYLKIEYPEGLLYYTRSTQNGKYILSYDANSSNPVLSTNEQHSLYIFTSPSQALYSINPVTLEINLLSEINVYRPSLHQTYNFIAYTSDRREQGNYDIWLYDLNTNEESMLLEDAFFINWYDSELIFKSIEADKIRSYNLSTKRIFDLFDDVNLYKSLSDEWIVYTLKTDKHLYFYNLKTRLLQKFEAIDDMYLQLPSHISSNQQFVFGTGYKSSLVAEFLFYFIFDLATGELHSFSNINTYTQCEANIIDGTLSEERSFQKVCSLD